MYNQLIRTSHVHTHVLRLYIQYLLPDWRLEESIGFRRKNEYKRAMDTCYSEKYGKVEFYCAMPVWTFDHFMQILKRPSILNRRLCIKPIIYSLFLPEKLDNCIFMCVHKERNQRE